MACSARIVDYGRAFANEDTDAQKLSPRTKIDVLVVKKIPLIQPVKNELYPAWNDDKHPGDPVRLQQVSILWDAV
jgi:hypothetical protein